MRIALLLLFAVSALGQVQVTNQWPQFFIMMFENHGYSQVTANSYWQKIIADSFLLTNYHGVTHPSQPNYVAQLGGSYFTCTDDSPCNLKQSNLVDLLEKKGGLTWKSYQENYVPGANGACNLITTGNSYYRKHNPFMSFVDITSDTTRCQNIVNETIFQTDAKNGKLPNFGYYTPNINDDSHDQNLDYSGNYLTTWLATWFTPYPNTWKNVLFMITFDEDEGSEGNHVIAIFRGLNATAGGTAAGSFTHYSVTKFIEDNWGHGNLGQNDVTANNFADSLS